MSLVTVELMRCDGPQCRVECRKQTPVGWITFHGVGGDYHLCTICAADTDSWFLFLLTKQNPIPP